MIDGLDEILKIKSIDDSYKDLAYSIVADACQEWMWYSERIKKLGEKDELTPCESWELVKLRGNRAATEKWLTGEQCEMYCDISGKHILEFLRKRLEEKEGGIK